MGNPIKKYEDVLQETIFEAERFLTRAKIALEDVRERREDAMYRSHKIAAALRASLDLSSALVALRKTDRY